MCSPNITHVSQDRGPVPRFLSGQHRCCIDFVFIAPTRHTPRALLKLWDRDRRLPSEHWHCKRKGQHSQTAPKDAECGRAQHDEEAEHSMT